MAWRFRRRAEDPIVGWATLTCFVVAAFFFGLMLGPANPFRTVTGAVPLDGLGPQPPAPGPPVGRLSTPPPACTWASGLHDPVLVTPWPRSSPAALGEGWLVEYRRWTLFAWGLLTVGIVLGAWWSYQVLGWGGFWAWDPVEKASFLPWLCMRRAYLHSVMDPGAGAGCSGCGTCRCSWPPSASRSRHLPYPFGCPAVGATRSRSRPSARSSWASSVSSWRSGSASSPGGGTACGRRGASTRRCRARAASS